MFTLKAFSSPDHNKYDAGSAGMLEPYTLDREVFEGGSYQIARVANNHVAVLFSNPERPAMMGQLHVGPGLAFWRVIIENSAGTNVEKIQISTDPEHDWVSF